MLKIITDRNQIRKAQVQFEKVLGKILHKKIKGLIGHKGESWDAKFNWSGKLEFWAAFKGAIEDSRYWNAFGLKEPKINLSNSITAEINFPLEGINRRIAGVLLKDEKGNIFVCHSGRIGGGAPDIGKKLFIDNYRGEWVTPDEEEAEVALVGQLNSPQFPYQIKEFVLEVERIKKIGKGELPKIAPKSKASFSPEFYGERRFKISKEVISNCNHGHIVGELARTLEAKGVKVGNSRQRDLYTLDKKGSPSSLFEIKTDISLDSLYKGTGQLLLNSTGLKKRPQLIFVLPRRPAKMIEEKLDDLGIEFLIYRMDGKKVDFKDMEGLKIF